MQNVSHAVSAQMVSAGGSLREVSRVIQCAAISYDVVIDKYADSSSALSVDRISIPLHEASAEVAVSQRLLCDSPFRVEEWMSASISDRFLRAESDAFVNGDGINKPTGFLCKTQVSDDVSLWGTIGYISTGTSGDFDPNNPADALIDLIYCLGVKYREAAVFVLNSKTAAKVRKIKDDQGRFVWTDAMHAAHSPRLFGYPVLLLEAMPDIAPNAHAIAFGNFEKGYTIAERPDLRILRDPFSAWPNVMFYATKRVGGDVSDYAAIKTLRFATN